MKKFTLVFVLSVLTLTFASMYFFFMVAKTIPQKSTNNQTSTESVQDERISLNTSDLGPSIYEDYTKELYDTALKEKRVLVLFFTANWCPICREQEPVNQELFDNLTTAGVVALKVHILDSETTDETDALAKKFDVTYQHTFVILDTNGAVSYKYTGSLEKEEIIRQIEKARLDSFEENNQATDSAESEVN